jgi:chromosome segregation protein
MYLSKLRIFGFKSFANRVEVNFPSEGITSVVGPNGCGKSNIIDAIRWVLGEQRARALRSSKMEDVIFSGTADRPAMGMAEVSLLINNDSGVLPSDYTQVMITRRAYRNGESEYLINNQSCRLKDIHNLFYDTGMGAASYSLIEAKMIDSILSDKAEERRVMFEEAAGISKYKQQRKETLRQLERTAQDLTRVEDGLRHVQQNVSLFERQAKKAEKWREIHATHRSLELSFQYDSFLKFSEELEELQSARAKDENRQTVLDARRATEEATLEVDKLALFEEERQVAMLSQKAAGTQAEAVRLENEAVRNRDRIEYLEDSLRRLQTEAAESRTRLGEMGRQRVAASKEMGGLENFLTDAADKTAAARLELDVAAARVREARSEADSLNEERMSSLHEMSGLKQRLSAVEGELQHLQGNEEEWGGEREAREERLLETRREREEVQRGLAEAERAAQTAVADLDKLLRAVEENGAELERERAREQDLHRTHVALDTQRTLLQSLEAGGEGMDAGVKYLLGEAKDQLQALLIDVLQVPEEFLVPVERALGKSLQVILVEDQQRGTELLNALRTSKKGDAVFGFPFPSKGTGGSSFRRERPDLSGHPGFHGWLVEKVRCPSQWSEVLEWALGHHGLIDSLDTAFAAAPSLSKKDLWLWTPGGEALHASGVLYGGSPVADQAGLLQRKAQLRDVQTRLQGIETDLSSAVLQTKILEEKKIALSRQVELLRLQGREAERNVHELRARVEFRESQAKALDSEVVQLRLKLDSTAGRKSDLLRDADILRGTWNQAEEARRTLESRFLAMQEKLQEQNTELGRLEADWRRFEQERAEAEARLLAARARIGVLQNGEVELQSGLERSAAQREEWDAQAQLLREKNTALADEIQSINERLAGEERARDAVKTAYDAKAGHLEERRVTLRHVQDELRGLTDEVHRRSLRLEQLRSALQSIQQRMFERHEVDFAGEEVLFDRVEYNPDTVQEQIADSQEKLKSLGNINAGALEDYEAEKARLEEVRKQFDDLDKARQGLERAIKKLDKAAREQFLTTFAVVQKNFQEVFSSLFEGGEAQLALEENIDPLDSRIEINARPTGKKMRGVSLLSGGERALTAISLLFALYLVRPSPYCIMDEVDGPLDDANIGRFVNLLRRFSHQTQFIVVTHNKRTMAASDMLYGVTQEVKGISKLVAVQLDEAARIAA